jgi:hypothetical protein
LEKLGFFAGRADSRPEKAGGAPVHAIAEVNVRATPVAIGAGDEVVANKLENGFRVFGLSYVSGPKFQVVRALANGFAHFFPGSEGKVLFQFLIDFDRLIFRAGRKKRGGKGNG